MCPAPLQMVHDDQPNINPERSMVLHPLLAVDKHTPLPIHRKRRPGLFNTLPYVTSFGSESGSSSRFHFSFDLKHPFVAMSDLECTTLYIHFWKWLNEGLLVRHNTKNGKEERYKKNKSVLQMWFHFGIVTVQNKNWFYSLAYKNQLLDDSIYDSLRGGALHDSSVENEIKKYAQLIPMYLSKSDFYGKKDIDISSHPKYKSYSECDFFEMIYVNDISQQDAGRLDCGLYMQTISIMEMGFQIPSIQSSHVFNMLLYCGTIYGVQKIQADATPDNEAPERPIRIHRDCDSSEKITIN
ncbi:hypothetical protein MTR67_025371 [Solanum verrucosum]|uniref:Ulp1 protease family, C-terminal catalytic domain containing protein n=1 Tax=Solanum verrucosum TaxID=315347 RepID=A0AAF0TTH9_SOLVR|nr:hypothetical protein MTR67_025371 [Solanum verrucosum]